MKQRSLFDNKEELTTEQLARASRGYCPDCGGTLLAGPRGGMSQNVLCSACGHKFNICPGFRGERID